MFTYRPLLGAFAAIALMSTPALADRDPTPEERTMIEAKLQELGFTAWDDIEFDEDDNYWEIDEARAADGREYDLVLDPQTLEILTQRED
jgi:uncharacterized membrane protein YkoI